MNSDNKTAQKYHAESGNAAIYIMVALALLGILTAVLANQSSQTDSQNLTEENAQFQTTQLLSFAQSAQSTVNQMVMSGTDPYDIDFAKPNASSFDTAPYANKLFHPDGGGLILKEANSTLFTGTANDPDPGWYIGMFSNVEGTPTTAPDIILTAYQISRAICENINEKVTGSTTIPALAGGDLRTYLIDEQEHSGSNDNLEVGDCAVCRDHINLCISDPGGTIFAFYSIIEAQ